MNVHIQNTLDSIIEKIALGVLPWQKPWQGGALPQNLLTRKPYRGMNHVVTAFSEFSSPYWITFKQARKLGGNVNKGSKGTKIFHFGTGVDKDKNTGKDKAFQYWKVFTIFNLEQCSIPECHIPASEVRSENASIEAAESIMEGFKDAPKLLTGNEAFYAPKTDEITMPHRDSFKDSASYYSTLFHESAHAVDMHPTRLGQKMISEMAFGDSLYSKGELVAEFTASFLSAQAGIVSETVDNSASYIDNWHKSLQKDPSILMSAASRAQKVTDYILDTSPEYDE